MTPIGEYLGQGRGPSRRSGLALRMVLGLSAIVLAGMTAGVTNFALGAAVVKVTIMLVGALEGYGYLVMGRSVIGISFFDHFRPQIRPRSWRSAYILAGQVVLFLIGGLFLGPYHGWLVERYLPRFHSGFAIAPRFDISAAGGTLIRVGHFLVCTLLVVLWCFPHFDRKTFQVGWKPEG